MKIDVEVNVYDVYHALLAAIQHKYPGVEVGDIMVLSWNKVLFSVQNDMVHGHNIYHALNPAHSTLFKP